MGRELRDYPNKKCVRFFDKSAKTGYNWVERELSSFASRQEADVRGRDHGRPKGRPLMPFPAEFERGTEQDALHFKPFA
jgi:hypothetical protein